MAEVKKDYGNGDYKVKYSLTDKFKGGMLELVTKFGGFLNGKNVDTSGIRNIYDEGIKNEAIKDYEADKAEEEKQEQEKIELSQNVDNATNKIQSNIENPNLETSINGMNFQSLMNKVDEWRKEDFERQDTAISRKIEDMRRAGVNPNLAYTMNGLESTTNNSTDLVTTYMNNLTEKEKQAFAQEFEKAIKDYEIFLNQEFEGDQKDKDRLYNLLGKILGVLGIVSIGSN